MKVHADALLRPKGRANNGVNRIVTRHRPEAVGLGDGEELGPDAREDAVRPDQGVPVAGAGAEASALFDNTRHARLNRAMPKILLAATRRPASRALALYT